MNNREMGPRKGVVVSIKDKVSEHPKTEAFEDPRGTIAHNINTLASKILGQIDPDRKPEENKDSLIKAIGEHAKEIRSACAEIALDPGVFEDFFDASVLLLSQPNETNRADFDKNYNEAMEAIDGKMAENYPSENDGVSTGARI